MRDQIDQLFAKEMTRKDFLQHVGSGMLILFGISGLIKAFTSHQPSKQTGFGYGASTYGGFKK